MEPPPPQKTWYLIDPPQIFSQSLIWRLQRHYFSQKGIAAWREGEVPHYVTNNPTVARCYAEIVFGLWRDQQHRQGPELPAPEPLYICELGAGSGRLGFYFLNHLARLCREAGVPLRQFCYVLTDFTPNLLDFWRQHPRFQEFFAQGVLDLALFDVNQTDRLQLQVRGQEITAASLSRPLVAIANYLFDSIPQDLYYFEAGQAYECRVSLFTEQDPQGLDPSALLPQLHFHYDYEPLPQPPYPEAALQQLFNQYQRSLHQTHLLFPATGLRCLSRLQALSQQGLVLLSADKGEHQFSALAHQPPPDLVHHGSFSITVNYHALKSFCEQQGGMALVPGAYYSDVNVIGLLLLPAAPTYVHTQHAYQRYVRDFGPDDFYTITQQIFPAIFDLTPAEIFAYLRLSHYDTHQFTYFLPRLVDLLPELNPDQQQALQDAFTQVWAAYFPLGEELDLAYILACLCYDLGNYPQALAYFAQSIALYGQRTNTLYNMALCHHRLGQPEAAAVPLQRVLQANPQHPEANALLAGVAPTELDLLRQDAGEEIPA